MAREFYEKSLKEFLNDFVDDEALSGSFKEGLGALVAAWTSSTTVKIKDILHLLTKEELLKIQYNGGQTEIRLSERNLAPIEIDIFLKRLDEKRRAFSAGKIFNDPIHGHMEIHPACLLIINTPQFQRLRYIKQLGMCYFVFPGASHNRFEHSIGTCYLAGQFCRSLRENQPELGITDMDILCVEIAGLCHDLGHGPFSRLFVDRFLPTFAQGNGTGQPQKEYARKHKVPSAQMFDFLLEENVAVKRDLETKYNICGEELDFIKEQINGPPVTGSTAWPYKGRKEHKAYLYEIVSNLRNGIDVCKWDYMARDCHHLGLRNNFDHRRYMKFARVIQESGEHQICLRDKEAGNVYNMFYTRYTLNKYAYKHAANCAIEEMVVDVLKKADSHLLFGREELVDVLEKAEEHLKIAIKCMVDAMENARRQSTDASAEVISILTKAQKNFEHESKKMVEVIKDAKRVVNNASENMVDAMENAGSNSTDASAEVISILIKAQKNFEDASKIAGDVMINARKQSTDASEEVISILTKAQENFELESKKVDDFFKNAKRVVVNLASAKVIFILTKAQENLEHGKVVQGIKDAKRDVTLANANVVGVMENARVDSTDSSAEVISILTAAQENFEHESKKMVEVIKDAKRVVNNASETMVDAMENAGSNSTDASAEVISILKKAQKNFKSEIKKVISILTKAQENFEHESKKMVEVIKDAKRVVNNASETVISILIKAQKNFKAASKKVVDLLNQAGKSLNLGKKGMSMSNYSLGDDGTNGIMRALSELTDDVLYKIRYDRRLALNDSKEILQRIYERKLYTCVYKSDPLNLSILKEPPNANDIERDIGKEDPSLKDTDFFVQIVHLDFGMKEENPVRRLRVFGKDNLYEARHLPEDEVSRILRPPNHDEQEIRFYGKRSVIKKTLKIAAKKYIKDLEEKIEREKRSRNN